MDAPKIIGSARLTLVGLATDFPALKILAQKAYFKGKW
jgi:hypothetical protein